MASVAFRFGRGTLAAGRYSEIGENLFFCAKTECTGNISPPPAEGLGVMTEDSNESMDFRGFALESSRFSGKDLG